MVKNSNMQVVPISELPLWEKAKKNRTLLTVTLEMTARCNNNCAHCYINLPVGDTRARSRELTTEEIKALVDETVSMGTLWFLLTGGEPLLREDFTEIYRYIKQKGMLISVFTNATLLSENHIQLFKKYPPRGIEVTIYGVTAETYERVTGKKNLAAAMRGVDMLVQASMPVTLKSTILRANYHELDKIENYCRDTAVLPFRFDPFLHLRLDGDVARNRSILAQRLNADEIVALEKSDAERYAALQKKCGELQMNPGENIDSKRIFRCQAGTNSCCIGYDGTFKLCSSLSDARFTYDLRSGSLKDAWERFAPLIKKMNSQKQSFKDSCGSCVLFDLCMWCPAHACLESGRYDEPIPYFCEIAYKRKTALEPTM